MWAEYTATPGLIITPSPAVDYQNKLLLATGKHWRITHEGTGKSVISNVFCRRTARWLAGVLGGFCDWTVPTTKEQLQLVPEECMKYLKVLKG